MTLRTAWLNLAALILIWLGTMLTVFVGVPALVPDPVTDSSGGYVTDSKGERITAGPDPASVADHRRFLIVAGLGMGLVTAGMVMQGWEAGTLVWRRYRQG